MHLNAVRLWFDCAAVDGHEAEVDGMLGGMPLCSGMTYENDSSSSSFSSDRIIRSASRQLRFNNSKFRRFSC